MINNYSNIMVIPTATKVIDEDSQESHNSFGEPSGTKLMIHNSSEDFKIDSLSNSHLRPYEGINPIINIKTYEKCDKIMKTARTSPMCPLLGTDSELSLN